MYKTRELKNDAGLPATFDKKKVFKKVFLNEKKGFKLQKKGFSSALYLYTSIENETLKFFNGHFLNNLKWKMSFMVQ